jgi:hypothetical protein
MKFGVIQGNLAVVFNPIASITLKWLRFKILRCMQYLHHSALLNNGLGFVSSVGLSRNQ